ncbi:hypothetical protein MUG91_G15n157 [Manis pentadactyla]|nr:hypothetical protein MUG91_G15n157 [Manis pentadactyla]
MVGLQRTRSLGSLHHKGDPPSRIQKLCKETAASEAGLEEQPLRQARLATGALPSPTGDTSLRFPGNDCTMQSLATPLRGASQAALEEDRQDRKDRKSEPEVEGSDSEAQAEQGAPEAQGQEPQSIKLDNLERQARAFHFSIKSDGERVPWARGPRVIAARRCCRLDRACPTPREHGAQALLGANSAAAEGVCGPDTRPLGLPWARHTPGHLRAAGEMFAGHLLREGSFSSQSKRGEAERQLGALPRTDNTRS